MEKVVVTGSKGGTGVSIVRILREAGYQVEGIDVKLAEFGEENYHQFDLEDGASLHDICAGAVGIVHFGSFPGDTQTSWEVAYRNLMLGGYHVLQAAANLRIPRVVLASSPEVYCDPARMPYLPIDEQSPQAPPSIYGACKQALEGLAQNYVRWHGIAIAALRPQRIVYEGSYEWRFRRYTQKDAAAASALWSYSDARDVATACLAWLRSDRPGFEAFNLASDDVCVTTPTRELVRAFYPHITDLRAPLEGTSSLVNCDKLKRMLGWEPRYRWQAMAAESG